MIRHSIIFLVAFALGALVVIAIRTSLHQPYQPAMATGPVNKDPVITQPVHAQTHLSTAASTPINTICAICGMPVDPAITTALYQQKIIGFGCHMCPAKFAKDPEKYGPSALRNEVVE